jgi:hypothetical protein
LWWGKWLDGADVLGNLVTPTGNSLGDPGQRIAESLSEKSEMDGGEGFWLCARRTVPRIPKAGCKERPNEAHGQKRRRRPVPIFQTDSQQANLEF